MAQVLTIMADVIYGYRMGRQFILRSLVELKRVIMVIQFFRMDRKGKYWDPWPNAGSSTYVEVAVITDDNYRFEFQHMDETRLSAQSGILFAPDCGFQQT